MAESSARQGLLLQQGTTRHQVVVALGSNCKLADRDFRVYYIECALKHVAVDFQAQHVITSGLFETVTAQFANPAAVEKDGSYNTDRIKPHNGQHCASESPRGPTETVTGANNGAEISTVVEPLTNRSGCVENKSELTGEKMDLGNPTEAMTGGPVPPHLNAVVCFETTAITCPMEALRRLLAIEAVLVRNSTNRKLPVRTIDLDLLLFDSQQRLDVPAEELKGQLALTLPHPRMHERNFVLFPLRDVIPEGFKLPLAPPAALLVIAGQTPSSTDRLTEEQPQLSPTVTLEMCIQFNLNRLVAIASSLFLPPFVASRLAKLPSRHFVLPAQALEALAPMLIPNRIVVPGPSNELWDSEPNMLPKVMGVINVTTNSFSDGGLSLQVEDAVQRARRLLSEGAHVIDVGGESTAPGRLEVAEDVEINRVVPVIAAIRKFSQVPISVDTRRSKTLAAAVAAGANILNDVSGGHYDPNILKTAAALGVGVILGHMKGTPYTMDKLAVYNDRAVEVEVAAFLREAVTSAQYAGIPRWRIMVDVGIGFSKTATDNEKLIRGLHCVAELLPPGISMCIGFSRKRFLSSELWSRWTAKTPPDTESGGSLQFPEKNWQCLEVEDPIETDFRDNAGMVITAMLATEQLRRQPTASDIPPLALIRTHAVLKTRISLELASRLGSPTHQQPAAD